MSLTVWILLGVALWLVLGVAVALFVGRMARFRDRQIPHDPPEQSESVTGHVPEPRDGSDTPSERSVGGPAGPRSSGSPPA